MSSFIPVSQYLSYFLANRPTVDSLMTITGDIMLVEKMAFPEPRTASGIIMASGSHGKAFNSLEADKPNFYRVLAVGAGFYDDDTGKDVAVDTQPGSIVLLGSVSVKLFSQFPLQEAYVPDTIGIAREMDVQIKFKTEAEFVQFLTSFNGAVKAEVEARRGAAE